jgi:ketosteroid isomerase-like protein
MAAPAEGEDGMAPKDEVAEYFSAINRSAVSDAFKAFNEDATYWGVETANGKMRRKVYKGREVIVAYIQRFLDNMAPERLHFDVLSIVGEGPTVVAEWRDKGGDSTGRKYENRGVNVFEFDESGGITTMRPYFDGSQLEGWVPEEP